LYFFGGYLYFFGGYLKYFLIKMYCGVKKNLLKGFIFRFVDFCFWCFFGCGVDLKGKKQFKPFYKKVMTLNEFIKQCAEYDNPIGDLANDILGDNNFPAEKSDIEILDYIDMQTKRGRTNDIFQEFHAEYQKIANATLLHILNFLRENEVSSIEIALEKQIAKRYSELIGYIIKIPCENGFPETVIEDLRTLGTMNRQSVMLSDGTEVQSNLFNDPHINDGNNITFGCQEVQFDFLLALIED